MSQTAHITARDWRRRPPLRLTVTEKPDACWWWVNCGRYGCGCNHRAAIAVAPLVIRWGPDAWSDMLRAHAKCSSCGHRGATLTHASWGDSATGWAEFPVDQMAVQ